MEGNRKWRKVGGPRAEAEFEFFKWNEEGQSIEGIWKGTTKGKFGSLGLVEDELDRALKAFPLHTVLENRLSEVEVGASVRIEYLGLVSGRTHEYKDFDVYMEDDS